MRSKFVAEGGSIYYYFTNLGIHCLRLGVLRIGFDLIRCACELVENTAMTITPQLLKGLWLTH